ALLISSSLLSAQSDSSTPVDFGVWPSYNGNHELGNDSPWRLVVEGTAKRNKGGITAQANLLLGGLGYEWKRDRQVSAGFAIQQHIPFDSASQPYKWMEYRLFQQVKFPIEFHNGVDTVKQRVRLEQRWEARKSAPSYNTVTSYNFELIL